MKRKTKDEQILILKIIIIFMIMMTGTFFVMYINIRADYILQRETIRVLLEKQSIYIDKYKQCLEYQVTDIERKLNYYEVFAGKLMRYYLNTKGYMKAIGSGILDPGTYQRLKQEKNNGIHNKGNMEQ